MSYPRNTKKEWKCFRLFHLFSQKLKLFQIVAARGWTDSVNITFVPFLNYTEHVVEPKGFVL